MRVPDGFLNVDLEVGGRTRVLLAPLVLAQESQMMTLYRGRMGGLYRAHFETCKQTRGASATLHALAETLEALPRPARRAWNAAVVRDFNIGVSLERGVRSIELSLDPEAVRRIVALRGRIAFTAYQEAIIPTARIKRPRGASTPRRLVR